MSYILDALRKSETERRQGKIPDLGQQVQLIHRPRKKRISPAVWIAVALVLNAVVLAAVFWPKAMDTQPASDSSPATAQKNIAAETIPESTSETVPDQSTSEKKKSQNIGQAVPTPTDNAFEEGDTLAEAGRRLGPEPLPELVPQPIGEEPVWERPTIIVPSPPVARDRQTLPETKPIGRVPHLVELPLSFQKSIPDLIFNSHIYASEPSARRVMINSNYLRRGDSFSGLKVENITEDGVVLSKHGQRFRVGIVRDWVSPH